LTTLTSLFEHSRHFQPFREPVSNAVVHER
jgi:hypothetical protein